MVREEGRLRIDEMLGSFSRRRLIVIGDIIVDEYNTGEALGLSAETPTIVARHVGLRRSLGGAALMVRNVIALGGNAVFVSIHGDDVYRSDIERFEHAHLVKRMAAIAGRQTTVKSRYWIDGYKLLQWDRLDHSPISEPSVDHLLSDIRRNLSDCDAIIVSDYRHGLISPSFAAALVGVANQADKPIYIDSQVSQRSANHRWYAGATLFCVNEREARGIYPEFDPADLPNTLAAIKAILNAQSIVFKRGADGCCALLGDAYVTVPAAKVQVIDTTGAGDAFFAALSLSPVPLTVECLGFANLWAGISTTIKGPEPPDVAQLYAFVEGEA
jgi:D-beta-D-heptose 7-phosphate kinase/D-beta-D-heptose 1-phosphate adenosyltransferase